MLKPFGGACEKLGVFVPTNFAIKQSKNGYEVYTAENVLLATTDRHFNRMRPSIAP